jgi:hypothetical protein
MAKQKLTGTFSTEHQLFEDLENYKEFCVDFGYKFDESTLYDMRNYVYRQHNKQLTGKPVKNSWDDLIASTPR